MTLKHLLLELDSLSISFKWAWNLLTSLARLYRPPPLPDAQTVRKQGRLCLAEPAAAPIMQTPGRGQVVRGVCESCFSEARRDWMDFLSRKNIPCQQPSTRLSGNKSSTCPFHSNGLDWFGLGLDWHLLASFMSLKERLEQSWQEAEMQRRKRWKESRCITSKRQRMLHGNKLHSNKWGTRMVI